MALPLPRMLAAYRPCTAKSGNSSGEGPMMGVPRSQAVRMERRATAASSREVEW